MTKSPRVALYLRVSTRDQTFASQERELRGYCRRRGWSTFTVYQEKASGYRAGREVLNELMTDARKGRVDIIAVYKIDRWGRSILHAMQTITELSRIGVGLVSATEPIDTTKENPAGEFLVTVFAALAKFTGDQIRERVNAGVAAAKRRGVKFGRGRDKQTQVTKAMQLLAKNGGVREIARLTGLSPAYVSMLKNGKRKSE